MLQLTQNVRAMLFDDGYAKLTAEGTQLLKERDIALAADPRSETCRQYVARMQAHIAALAVYLNISGTTE